SGVERVLLLHELLDPLEDPFVLRVLRHMPSFRNPSPRPLAGCRSHHRTLRGRETLEEAPARGGSAAARRGRADDRSSGLFRQGPRANLTFAPLEEASVPGASVTVL